MSKTVCSAVLTTLQQLETRIVRTDGEFSALREDVDAQHGSKSYERDEMMAAARDYATVLHAEITHLVERLDANDGVTAKSKLGVDG